ncbi:hypothetical protein ANN_16283 [Periplaneta americana]|uniref:Uncharacterized protein n=1 Tax=Periplaneta americana TaxID=6978 RepID=A0ABQ8SIJ6_PERAM|nr:hypothetical protein ANN_16283 [Periplaneta americana]
MAGLCEGGNEPPGSLKAKVLEAHPPGDDPGSCSQHDTVDGGRHYHPTLVQGEKVLLLIDKRDSKKIGDEIREKEEDNGKTKNGLLGPNKGELKCKRNGMDNNDE